MELLEKSSHLLAFELEKVLCEGRCEVREALGWRPQRHAVLGQLKRRQGDSGRFLGVLGLEVLSLSGDDDERLSLAQALGIEAILKDIFLTHGVACCPNCGNSCRVNNLEESRTYWERVSSGVILLGVELPVGSIASGRELSEQAEFWGAQRVTDGNRLWAFEELAEASIDSRSSWYVVLDSTQAPISAAFELNMRALVERVSGVGSSRLFIFHRPADLATLTRLVEVGAGWRCESCDRSYGEGDILRRRIGEFDSIELCERPLSTLETLCRQIPITYPTLTDAAIIVKRAMLSELAIGCSVAHLSFSEKHFVQLARAFIGGIRDTPFILDSVCDIMAPAQKEAFCAVRTAFEQRNNALVDFSAMERGADLSANGTALLNDRTVEKFSDMLAHVCREPGIHSFAQEAFAAVDSPLLFNRAIRRIQADEAVNNSTRGVTGISILDLRKSNVTSFGALIGLREVFEDFIMQTRSTYRAGRLCAYCLGSGNREFSHGVERCACAIDDAHERFEECIILGRPLAAWVHAPLTELLPLVRGYQRTSRLLDSILALGFGGKTAAYAVEELPDLQRHASRLLLAVSGVEMDRYKKTKKRRQGKPRALIFLRPWWVLSDELAELLRRLCDRLILPDDTVVYLDSRP